MVLDGPGYSPDVDTPGYREMIERLYALSRGGTKFGLERIERLLSQLGHPERSFPTVHVAGSNGKGSTSAFIASMLAEHGRSVGLFTSPHLISLTERVQFVDLEGPHAIEPDALVRAVARVEGTRPGFDDLSFFEAITAAALWAMRERSVDIGVIEAGLGARLDATRLVDASVAVLTDLSLEHTAILGDTIADIAREEGAVVRPGRPLIMADGPELAMNVVDRLAADAGAPVSRLGRDFHILGREAGVTRLRSSAGLEVAARLPLSGPHQSRNAAVALQAVLQIAPTLPAETARRGLERARWPGRMEVLVAPGRPSVLLDGAQNAHAAEALAAGLCEEPTRTPVHFVFGALRDKDVGLMLAALAPLARSWTFTRPASVRAKDPAELAELLPPGHRDAPCSVAQTPHAALETAWRRAEREGGQLVVCGSLYLVGDVRALLLAAGADSRG
jgi:dihydrofolate synthase/folylpolyglutamate synthase